MRRNLICFLVAAALGAGPMARAAEPADQLFEQAAAAFHAGQLAEAEGLLQRAWAMKKTYDIAGNLGVIEVQLGKLPQAAEHLSWALQHFPPTETDKARRGYEKQLEKARAEAGGLRITVSVAGAEVLVNGRVLGKAPLVDAVFVEPGHATVETRLAGYTAASRAVDVAKGASSEVALTLVPIAPPRRSLAPAVVLGAGAAVFLAGSAVLTGVANGKAADATALRGHVGSPSACPAHATGSCAQLWDALGSQSTLGNVALAGFVSAGVLALGATGAGIWAASGPKVGGVGAAPVVGAGFGGVSVRGSW